ncbi:hypothetical protein QN386_01390 [Pseudomonas sp. CCI3.2]|uniref:hypothetical protein n=1 Tax=unclassified Pseudomonas TaxID=196821 RepID=UPI002AC8A939|nr:MULTISPECIES: hypothetical protein [unclassified Pseudomonas]MEB0080321.1 hypothetical protein [Pseudomonas sp. MH10out]MEB0091611.1 hypothetical protein [Pseudomonas sp. CCI4.2]MEB0099986.1 hypothetical protein [Pseudomonas sp. CCI3.2]MEB0129848.1 hypothetical protein [Pseudomonas sp. CCI2.4]MEB0157787.1 hypothetical protein [Pseudomonas sp. AH2 (2023)]
MVNRVSLTTHDYVQKQLDNLFMATVATVATTHVLPGLAHGDKSGDSRHFVDDIG